MISFILRRWFVLVVMSGHPRDGIGKLGKRVPERELGHGVCQRVTGHL